MITTGSKLLVGSAVAAGLLALIYGVTHGGALGTIGLISAAAGLALLAGISTYGRDANVSAMDTEAFATSAAAQATATPSLWPLLVAVGATAMALGLASLPALFIIGAILVAAGALEWMVQGWSERASAERGYNSHARNFLIDPLELPVAAAIVFGIVAYSFSRVMLGLPSKTATVIGFSIVAALVLAIGAIVGTKRGASKAALTGTFGLATVALVAGGAVAGLGGEREIDVHKTTAYYAARGECGAEEISADDYASQTVAGKSNVAAEVIFDGTNLTWTAPGFVPGIDDAAPLTLPRSNPNNVLFRNESSSAARLVIGMNPRLDDDGQPTGPERICTALTEEGGVQFLTLIFDLPSFATDGGYEFSVPGSDATLEVVVP
jgi:hypothetical protein